MGNISHLGLTATAWDRVKRDSITLQALYPKHRRRLSTTNPKAKGGMYAFDIQSSWTIPNPHLTTISCVI